MDDSQSLNQKIIFLRQFQIHRWWLTYHLNLSWFDCQNIAIKSTDEKQYFVIFRTLFHIWRANIVILLVLSKFKLFKNTYLNGKLHIRPTTTKYHPCLDKVYTLNNFGQCCAHGSFRKEGHGEICNSVSHFVKSKKCPGGMTQKSDTLCAPWDDFKSCKEEASQGACHDGNPWVAEYCRSTCKDTCPPGQEPFFDGEQKTCKIKDTQFRPSVGEIGRSGRWKHALGVWSGHVDLSQCITMIVQLWPWSYFD